METKESGSGARALGLLLLVACGWPLLVALGAADFQEEFNRAWGYLGGLLTCLLLLGAIIEGLAWIGRKIGGRS